MGCLQMLPSCLMLHFAAADMEEGRGNLDAAKQIYEDLAVPLAPDTPDAEASQANYLAVPLFPYSYDRFLPSNGPC